MANIPEILYKKILVLDGAMGTMVQTYKLNENDFRGDRFISHSHDLQGNNDILCLTQPDIVEEIQGVDFAFLDATFFDGLEINTRNIAEIPHPFVSESMELFQNLPPSEKSKVYFVHFNHTNALLNKNSDC